MSQTGDDCYFYYYSTCAKGDSCPFRHQPAALGCEVTCNLWEKGTCFKKACTFRHMVIEKDRSTIPCLWENRQSGCMKPYCPFLHTKPKNIPTSAGPPQSVVDPARDNATGQSIPTLSGNPRPTRPMHPPPAIGRAGPHMYNGPPPINMPHNQGPYMGGPQPMQQRPMRYQGFIPRSQPSHPMVYQMHNNQLHMAPMTYAGVIPGVIPNMLLNNQRGGFHRNTGSDYDDSDDYTSSDFSDVSLSDDERKVKSKDSSHRRVQSPRHVKNKREVRQRSDRSKRTESRSTRDTHSDRKANRRKYEEKEKEKERSRKDSDRNRSKPRKHSDDKNSSSERKRSESPTDKNKSDPDKAKSDPEESKDDIKVKTLEEILREKALKNLHERTAQKKKAQMEAEKARKEEGKEDNDSDSPEPILKSVVSVSKAESTSSQKEPLKSDDENDDDDDDDNEVQFVRETKAHFRSPKTIIRSIIDPDNESQSASTKTFRKIKEVEPAAAKTEKPRENKEEKGELKPLVDSTTKSTSDLTNIKIKTFEEIMEEKRQRKQQTSSIDQDIAVTTSESITQDKSTAVSSTVIPAKTRKIRVVKKAAEDTNKESKPGTGKLVVRRKVETAPRKEVANKELPSQAVQDEKTKENKKIVEIDKPTNIVIKSFDEIMREKRQRRQEQSQSEQPQPSEVSTSTVAAKKPTIIRKKPLISKPEQKPAAARTFKSRKLKVVGRQGITKSKDADNSEPTSPSKPECLSPATNTQTIGEPSSHQDTIQPLNVEREGLCSTAQESSSQIYSSSVGADDDDSDDDDSWEHEELPAVPILTPTLEGPAAVHDIPDGSSKPATVFHIPAGRTTEANTTVTQCHVSPTKRSRSSLEELFGVPCDDPDSKLDMEVLPEEKEKEVSPAKKVKTSQEAEKDIIKELSKTDDFDLELEEEIANLSPDKHFDPHETLNEDDLLLELEEMIND